MAPFRTLHRAPRPGDRGYPSEKTVTRRRFGTRRVHRLLFGSLDAVGDLTQESGQFPCGQLWLDLPGPPAEGWRVLKVVRECNESQCNWSELAEFLEKL